MSLKAPRLNHDLEPNSWMPNAIQCVWLSPTLYHVYTFLRKALQSPTAPARPCPSHWHHRDSHEVLVALALGMVLMSNGKINFTLYASHTNSITYIKQMHMDKEKGKGNGSRHFFELPLPFSRQVQPTNSPSCITVFPRCWKPWRACCLWESACWSAVHVTCTAKWDCDPACVPCTGATGAAFGDNSMTYHKCSVSCK